MPEPPSPSSSPAPAQVLQEMADKRHPYIVSLQHSFQDDQHLYLVMDFIGGGDLFSLIEKKGRLPEAWARIYSAEIALALNHLHEAGVIYRDLKPENVMVAITGHLKLTDFGFAKKMKGAPLARGSCACASL
jgi:serine/threonine protein kinase